MSQGPLLLSRSLNPLLLDFDTLITFATDLLRYGLIQLIIDPNRIIITFACYFFNKALGNKTDRTICVSDELARPFKCLVHYAIIYRHFLRVDQSVVYSHRKSVRLSHQVYLALTVYCPAGEIGGVESWLIELRLHFG